MIQRTHQFVGCNQWYETTYHTNILFARTMETIKIVFAGNKQLYGITGKYIHYSGTKCSCMHMFFIYLQRFQIKVFSAYDTTFVPKISSCGYEGVKKWRKVQSQRGYKIYSFILKYTNIEPYREHAFSPVHLPGHWVLIVREQNNILTQITAHTHAGGKFC